MNKFESITKPMKWFMALLLAALVVGCGGGDGIPGTGTTPGTGPGLAGASPVLGTASTYGVFASAAAVTLAVNSSVTGDVGLNPVGACNNCVVGTTILSGVIHNGDAAAIQAQTDFKAVYDEASIRTLNACPVSGDLSNAQANCTGYTPSTPGPVYGPGLYRTATDITLSGTMTLDAGGNADAVFIFQTDTALTTGSNSIVLLAGNAQAKNVWWIVGSAATLGVSSHFKGTVIANGAAVSVLGGTSLEPTLVEGRLFSHAAGASVNAYAIVTVPQ